MPCLQLQEVTRLTQSKAATGVGFLLCGHAGVHVAHNMFHGERFAYPRQVRFLAALAVLPPRGACRMLSSHVGTLSSPPVSQPSPASSLRGDCLLMLQLLHVVYCFSPAGTEGAVPETRQATPGGNDVLVRYQLPLQGQASSICARDDGGRVRCHASATALSLVSHSFPTESAGSAALLRHDRLPLIAMSRAFYLSLLAPQPHAQLPVPGQERHALHTGSGHGDRRGDRDLQRQYR